MKSNSSKSKCSVFILSIASTGSVIPVNEYPDLFKNIDKESIIPASSSTARILYVLFWLRCRGTQFDPELDDLFVNVLENDYEEIKAIQQKYQSEI